MGNCFRKSKETAQVKKADVNVANDSSSISSISGNVPLLGIAERRQQNSSHPLPTPTPPPNALVYPSNQKNEIRILPKPSIVPEISSTSHLKAFSLAELSTATRNFSPDILLGEGGFGYVYKGWLDKENLTATVSPGSGLAIAVKKLKPKGFQGHKEWLSEINCLGELHHPNLVTLIGYCLEGENRLLVYEYMPKGSLENHLFRRSKCLPWATRLKVAIGAAKGLCFLHSSESQIIYRDFKASNVLLDSDFNAKLSDFGLAKAGPTGDRTHISTEIMGTEGYTAPEYLATGRLTTKCDIYSFGVVLLELITGRRALDETKGGMDQILVDWVRPEVVDKGRIYRIMDTKLEGQYPSKAAFFVAHLGLQCAHHEPRARPHMSEIVDILEKISMRKTTDSSMQDPKSSYG